MDPKPKTKKSDITRQIIFQAALELIGEKGIDNVTLADIAQKAGVSKGLFYYYFETKEDILAYSREYSDAIYADAYDKAVKEETFEEMLSVLLEEALKEYAKLGREFIRSVLITALKTSTGPFTTDEVFNKYMRPILDYGVGTGVLDKDDIPQISQTMMTFFLGNEFMWCASDTDREIHEVVMEKLPYFLNGIKK